MRLGIYGGTFNPPHLGHIRAAAQALEALNLDRLLVIPDRIAPHKVIPEGSPSPDQRLEMVRLAIEGEPEFYYTDYELLRPGPNYSYLTCEALSEKLPQDAEMVFIVGGDSLMKLHQWRYPERVIRAMPLAVVYRPGFSMEAMEKSRQQLDPERITLIPCEGLEASSTGIRAGDLTQVPNAVADYICQRRLYGYEPR